MIFKELDTLTKCCGWINSRNGELYNNIDLVAYELWNQPHKKYTDSSGN